MHLFLVCILFLADERAKHKYFLAVKTQLYIQVLMSSVCHQFEI